MLDQNEKRYRRLIVIILAFSLALLQVQGLFAVETGQITEEQEGIPSEEDVMTPVDEEIPAPELTDPVEPNEPAVPEDPQQPDTPETPEVPDELPTEPVIDNPEPAPSPEITTPALPETPAEPVPEQKPEEPAVGEVSDNIAVPEPASEESVSSDAPVAKPKILKEDAVSGNEIKAAKYLVTMVIDESIQVYEASEGDTIGDLPVPHKEVSGSDSMPVFDGWYTMPDRTRCPSDMEITGNMTVYAIFKMVEKEYTVTFDTAGGSPSSYPSQSHKAGEKVTNPGSPEKDPGKFAYWAYSSREWNFDSDTVTCDMTLTAIYAGPYTVTFDPNGGSAVGSITAGAGELIGAPKCSRAGYTFAGWYTAAGYKWNFSKDTVNDNITLKAKWNPVRTDTESKDNEDSRDSKEEEKRETETPLNTCYSKDYWTSYIFLLNARLQRFRNLGSGNIIEQIPLNGSNIVVAISANKISVSNNIRKKAGEKTGLGLDVYYSDQMVPLIKGTDYDLIYAYGESGSRGFRIVDEDSVLPKPGRMVACIIGKGIFKGKILIPVIVSD